MCHVPSIAVFCDESIECFPGTASKFFRKLRVTIPVAIIIIIIIIIIIKQYALSDCVTRQFRGNQEGLKLNGSLRFWSTMMVLHSKNMNT